MTTPRFLALNIAIATGFEVKLYVAIHILLFDELIAFKTNSKDPCFGLNPTSIFDANTICIINGKTNNLFITSHFYNKTS